MENRNTKLKFAKDELSEAAPEKPKRKQKPPAEAKKAAAEEAQHAAEPETKPVTPRLFFDEEAKKAPSKLTHAERAAPVELSVTSVRRTVQKQDEDNPSVEASSDAVGALHQGTRTVKTVERSQKLRNLRNAQAEQSATNPYSRWRQRQAIRQEYAAAAKAGEAATVTTSGKLGSIISGGGRRVAEYAAGHKLTFLVLLLLAVMLLVIMSSVSSCTVFFDGIASTLAVSTYPSRDSDIRAAEAQYCRMEAELQEYLDDYEISHDYDEYSFDLDEIQHDPYVLISAITALHGGEWRIGEVQSVLRSLFDRQYILTETVRTETRQRDKVITEEVPMRDPDTGRVLRDRYGDIIYEEKEKTVRESYTYYICSVKLENFNLSHVPVYVMSEDQLSMYTVYMAVLGNRPDLFPHSEYVDKYNGDYFVYEIPPEALEDEVFAAMIKEAEKYLGYPYVWGGGNPSTSFDCSGFVSLVINNCGQGWNIGRQGTWGLLDACTPVSPSEAKPGDLIFFEGTYDTTGPSHVGLYVGNGMMIHCGDPIQYASVESSYFQQHFMCYGRLNRP